MTRVMVDLPIPSKWKELWEEWDVRGFIILSILLQTSLILSAPLRKRINSFKLTMPLWSAYLLADWVASFGVGLITNNQGNRNSKSSKTSSAEKKDLFALWASFLLVHLGGPDTITAFALEDNELWLRHLLGLLFQCTATGYVFLQSIPQNTLWIPTTLMFMTGIMKFGERTRALYLASSSRFKGSIVTSGESGMTSIRLMKEYAARRSANLPTRTEIITPPKRRSSKVIKRPLTQLEVVQYAYQLFENFKGLFSNIILSQSEQSQNRDFFSNRTAKDAFEVVEVELNLIYAVFYTKIPMVYGKWLAMRRFFSFWAGFSATLLFKFADKSKFSYIDVTITYGLFFGGLALEVIAILLYVSSDQALIYVQKSDHDDVGNNPLSKLKRILTGVLKQANEYMNRCSSHLEKFMPQPRWSRSISTYNVIDYSLHPRPKTRQKLYKWVEISDIMDCLKYVKPKMFTDELRDFIFEELKFKSELAHEIENKEDIISLRGDSVLLDEDWMALLPFILELHYDQSILLWHIATELCYNWEILPDDTKKCCRMKTEHQEMAKVLSDYMMYLLIFEPSMISATSSIGQIQFRDTCSMVKKLFENGKDLDQIKACKEIKDIPTELLPIGVVGDRSKSMLIDACKVAKELVRIENEKSSNKWLILSKIWVEMLCYGASHSQPSTQVAHVAKGGELITIVWLLMYHLGLGNQPKFNEYSLLGKFIVGK